MQMKRVAIITVFLTCFIGMQAQDLYRSTVKEYVKNNHAMFEPFINRYTESLNTITKQILTNFDDAQISAIIDDYSKKQLIDDLVDSLLIPVYKDAITQEEFQTQIALFQTPEGKIYQTHYANMMSKAGSESIDLKDLLLNLYGYILKGKPLTDIKINKKISKEFKNKYYQIADTSLVSYFAKSILDLYKEQFKGNEKQYNTINSYVKKNIGTFLINLCYESLTLDDLDFISRQKETGSQQRIENAMKGMMDNIVPYTQKILASYTKWLLRQKVVCEYLLRKIVEETNQEAKKENNNITCELSAKSFTYVLAGEKDIPDLKSLNSLLEKDKELVTNQFVYGFPLFENEEILRTIAYSQRDFIIAFNNISTGEKLQIEFTNEDIKNMVDHYQIISLTQKGLKFYENKSYDKALPLLIQAAEGGDITAQYNLSHIYNYGEGTVNKEEAMKWLSIVSEQNENKRYKADALNEMAYFYVEQKLYDKALTLINLAIETRPNEANYYDSKGEILYLMGNKKEAKEMWNKVVAIDPDFLQNHNSNLYRLLFKK